jgi:putative ABC transport system permease protein
VFNPAGPVPQFAHVTTVGPGYFRTLEIPLLSGRVFTIADNSGAPRVAIVNETLARGFWPKGDAIGKRIVLGAPRPGAAWMTIAGIARDIHFASLSLAPIPQIYMPYLQNPPGGTTLAVRAAGDPLALSRSVVDQIRVIDPVLPVQNIATLNERVSRSMATPRFNSFLVVIFAIGALLLAVVGTYGVVAHSTSQRTREIGVRMALGAQIPDVIRLIVLKGLTPVGFGALAGLAGSLVFSRMISTLLFQVTPADPAILILSVLVPAGASVLACIVPCIRAAKADPAIVLRWE